MIHDLSNVTGMSVYIQNHNKLREFGTITRNEKRTREDVFINLGTKNNLLAN
jgi:hypothetical protein